MKALTAVCKRCKGQLAVGFEEEKPDQKAMAEQTFKTETRLHQRVCDGELELGEEQVGPPQPLAPVVRHGG